MNTEEWLTGCDDEALAAGSNLAVLGSELLQFGHVSPLGEGRFRLSRLLRGRRGSEWACVGHAPGEAFCLLKNGTTQALSLPNWSIGAQVSAAARGGPAAVIEFRGESVRPPAPVNLAAELRPTGELAISWTRRSRQGFGWIDGVDAPLGEATEQYRVAVTGTAGSLERAASEPGIELSAADLMTLGSGEVTIEVCQIGNVAASRPARHIVTIP